MGMATTAPTHGLLTPAVASLVGDLLVEVNREDANPIADYIEMLQTSPICGPAVDVCNLLALSYVGDYSHPDQKVQAFINSNFEGMRGSLALALSELMSVKFLGYACSEWGVKRVDAQWKLKAIQILDPRLYRLEGSKGEIKGAVYTGDQGDIHIPYARLIHVVNGRALAFGDPYGNAEARRAIASWRAWKIVVSSMLIAAKRQGTPIVAGYAPSEVRVPLLGADGNPLVDALGEQILIPAPEALLGQLENLENNSVISTDIQNRIEAIQQQTSGAFFFEALRYLGQLQLLAFLVPETILTATGIGDSNLNAGQRGVLEISLQTTIDQIKEVLLDKLIRPLIVWNFGDRITEWGSFVLPEQEQGDRIGLLGAINQAVSTGFFSATDMQVINRARGLAGIPPVNDSLASMSLRSDYQRERNGHAHS